MDCGEGELLEWHKEERRLLCNYTSLSLTQTGYLSLCSSSYWRTRQKIQQSQIWSTLYYIYIYIYLWPICLCFSCIKGNVDVKFWQHLLIMKDNTFVSYKTLQNVNSTPGVFPLSHTECKSRLIEIFTMPIHTANCDRLWMSSHIKWINYITALNKQTNHKLPLLRVTVSFQLSPLGN